MLKTERAKEGEWRLLTQVSKLPDQGGKTVGKNCDTNTVQHSLYPDFATGSTLRKLAEAMAVSEM